MSEPVHTPVGAADDFQQPMPGSCVRDAVMVKHWGRRARPCLISALGRRRILGHEKHLSGMIALPVSGRRLKYLGSGESGNA